MLSSLISVPNLVKETYLGSNFFQTNHLWKISICAKFYFQMTFDFWGMPSSSFDGVSKPLAVDGEWMSLCLQFSSLQQKLTIGNNM